MIIDTHAHLTDEKLAERRAEIIAGLADAGIDRVVEAGVDVESSQAAARLAEDNPRIWYTAGVHPHEACRGLDETKLAELSAGAKCVAIGEIGLDYYYDLSDRESQKKVFERQLELAYELKKPVVLHIRDAYGDALEILKRHADILKYGVNLHCYSGSAESVREFSAFDAYFAFGGAITFKNAKKEEVIKAVPKDKILLETDCPYMTPVPLRGSVNEPKNILYTLKKLAEILDETTEEIARITTENAERLFGFERKQK